MFEMAKLRSHNVRSPIIAIFSSQITTLFGWLVADGWCWFVLREEYCWLVAGGWFVLREKYCWLVADKPNEQAKHAKHRYSRNKLNREQKSLQ
jgi:hypothetical protein